MLCHLRFEILNTFAFFDFDVYRFLLLIFHYKTADIDIKSNNNSTFKDVIALIINITDDDIAAVNDF